MDYFLRPRSRADPRAHGYLRHDGLACGGMCNKPASSPVINCAACPVELSANALLMHQNNYMILRRLITAAYNVAREKYFH